MFDYIIMNPPYGQSATGIDKNLHVKFLQAAVRTADTVVSIQPSTWINDPKKVREVLGDDRRIETVIYTQDESKRMFINDAGISQELCISKIMPGTGARVTWSDTGNTVEYPEGLLSYNPTDKLGNQVKSILEMGRKLSDTAGALNTHTFTDGRPFKAITDNIIAKRNRTKIISDPLVLKGKWCVKLTDVNQTDNTLIILKGRGTPFMNDGTDLVGRVYCVFDTQQQAENFYNYCQTDFVRTYAKVFSRGSSTGYPMKYIPWVPDDFRTVWDDARIAHEIGLTPEERQWLREMLPDCYHIRKPAVPHGAAGRTRNLLKSLKA